MIFLRQADFVALAARQPRLNSVFPNGARLQLFGADKPDSLRGIGFSGI